MKPTADFLTQAQACIEKVVREYRPKLLESYGNVDHEIKGDSSPVTQLDKELELTLRDALRGFDSSIGLQGEEHANEGSTDTFWLIDPIDGTDNFIRGIPVVYNLVTLIDSGEPVFAFMYRVIQDELLIAIKGKGATINGSPIRVSERPAKRSLIEISGDLHRKDVEAIVSAISEKVYSCRVFDDISYVATGKLDGHLIINSHGGPWDYAPIALMIAEAGGKVANIGSDSYDYQNMNIFASNPIIFDELMVVINRAAKKVGLI